MVTWAWVVATKARPAKSVESCFMVQKLAPRYRVSSTEVKPSSKNRPVMIEKRKRAAGGCSFQKRWPEAGSENEDEQENDDDDGRAGEVAHRAPAVDRLGLRLQGLYFSPERLPVGAVQFGAVHIGDGFPAGTDRQDTLLLLHIELGEVLRMDAEFRFSFFGKGGSAEQGGGRQSKREGAVRGGLHGPGVSC